MIESPWMLLGSGVLAVVIMMFALWLVGIARKNFSYVDIGWSANFAVLAVIYAALAPGYAPRKWLIAAMFCAHGLRLAWHLAARIVGHPRRGALRAASQGLGPRRRRSHECEVSAVL